MKNNLLLLSFFFSSFYYSFGQITNSKVEYFVIFELKDSLKQSIPTIKDNGYKRIIERISNDKASTGDYIRFVRDASFYGKLQYRQLNSFLNERVKTPENRRLVDLNYVILKSEQIAFIANELELEIANKAHEKLSAYLNSIEEKKSKYYKKAKLYLDIHNGLLKVIKQDIKGFDFVLLREKKAFHLGDTILALNYRNMLLNFYVYKNDLDGYIFEAKKSLEIEGKLKTKSPIYPSTIANLLDALIFKGDFDELYIESKLFELYSIPKFHYQSFSYYAKYVASLSENDPALKRIFQVFQVNNVFELCKKMRLTTFNNVNNNEYKHLIKECGRALLNHGFIEQSYQYRTHEIFITEKIYSKDLSQTIADFETREIEREKEFKIKQEKEKNKFYLIIIVVVAFFFIVSISLFILYLRKSNVLAIRNKEKDTLLREIHHRVKNNFELVNTLLELQSGDVESQLAKEKLSEGQSRISSMSLIHQKLYQTEYLEDLDFQEYTEQLVELILKSANKINSTQLSIVTNGLKLDIDTAIPLGLILNELCTNSCKYAFSDAAPNALTIKIEKQDELFYKLTYQDSGKAAINVDSNKPTGIGLLLIRSLTKQLQGKYTYSYKEGAYFEILFKNKNQRKEIE
jgi:two-component system, sensor histidine kinase PdtaS